MIHKFLLPIALCLISNPNYTFFGPIIKLHFQNKVHSLTVNTDLYPEYTYQDLGLDLAIEFVLAPREIEVQDFNTRIYLNLESYELVKGLSPDKPLHLIMTKCASPKPVTKSLFDFLDDDML